MEIGLAELVRNRTMSAEIAATLAGAAEERRSFVVLAVPRLAGKSTVLRAMLARASAPVRTVVGEPGEVSHLAAASGSGYLVIPEISQAPVAGYIWGAPVRRVFAVLGRGYALAAALHAPGVDEAFRVICGGNGVPDEDAARIDLAVYLRSIGEWQTPARRVVESVHEIHGVMRGKPRARALHIWDEASDRFATVNEPKKILAERWARLAAEFGRVAVS